MGLICPQALKKHIGGNAVIVIQYFSLLLGNPAVPQLPSSVSIGM